MSEGNKVLLGVLAGFAVGATVGVLFAPDKGSNTRRKIAKQGEDYVEGLEEKFNGFIDDITKKVESMKEEATGKIENGVKKAEVTVDKKVAAAAN